MYHGKRVAVVLRAGAVPRVFCCVAAFEEDQDLGPILRIALQQEGVSLAGHPAIILQENAPAECLIADDRYGCDYRLELGATVNPSR